MKLFFWGLFALCVSISTHARAQEGGVEHASSAHDHSSAAHDPAQSHDGSMHGMPMPLHEPFRTVKGHTIIYNLYISDSLVDYTGKRRHSIAVNGQLPGPILEFTEGDTAEIHIHNGMMMETSVHWHGIILPNQYDGVPWLTAPPIKPMETYVAKFPIVQNGTYWYHTHTMLQQQVGLYGAFIIHKRPGVADLAGHADSPAGKGSGLASAPGTGSDTGSAPGVAAGSASADRLPEEVVLLNDWTNEKPYEVNRSLHYATDWYAIKKHSTQDYAGAIKAHSFHTKLTNEWKRMLPMDVSDVAYDLFTVNGRREEERPTYKPGDKIRLRIINGASSSYFWMQYAGGKTQVIASDGQDVVPVNVDRFIIGPSETYDVVVTIPDNDSYQFRATAEDRSGFTSLWLGSGERKVLPILPPLRYFEGMGMMNEMMNNSGGMKPMNMHMSNQTMDMNAVMYPEAEAETGMAAGGGDSGAMSGGMDSMSARASGSRGMASMGGGGMASMGGGGTASMGGPVTLNYGMLRSPTPTTLPVAPTRELRFNLTGNMNRYVWSINNKTVSETDEILIHHGENIRIILYNGTMMRHPMHLHGHFFRLLNGQGAYSPLKEVVDILPMETDTLEFAATESGDWFFHCHILYHMMSGMGRLFHYEGSSPNPGLPDLKTALRHVYSDDREIRPMAKVGLESNGSDGEAMLANTRYRFQTEWRLGTDTRKGYESESHLGRYLGQMQYWLPYIGWDFRYRSIHDNEKNLFGQLDSKDHRNVLCAGIQYTLPLLLTADARIDTKGNVRVQLGREDIAVTTRLRFTFMVNTDKEYMAGLRYIVTKYFGFSTHYDSDMGYGAGITLSY